jgi:hypothetical protein
MQNVKLKTYKKPGQIYFIPTTSFPFNRIHPVKTIKFLVQFRVFTFKLTRLLIKLKM